jgi:hypothetical protein
MLYTSTSRTSANCARNAPLQQTWCLHESARYCGSAICGAKVGMLSSYAVSVMVLHLFNKYVNLGHPFSVLRSFLYTYMSFPWESSVLTIDGAVSLASYTSGFYGGYSGNSDLLSVSTYISNTSSQSGRSRGLPPLPPGPPPAASLDSSNRFQPILDALSQHPALLLYQQYGNAVHHGRFAAKFCNIQDPVDPYNNLGISVPRASLQLITQACRSGYHHLEVYLRRFPHCPPGGTQFGNNASAAAHEGADYTHTAQYDPTTGGYKYNGAAVKQMLSAVPPVNLGFVGTAPNAEQSNNNTTAGPYSAEVTTVETTHGATMPAIITNNQNNITGAGAGGIPFRRNSRSNSVTSYAANTAPPGFLTEFFPASLQLYSTPEGEPLRCDLLSHPLQPLSSSILLANPNYQSVAGSNGSIGSGSPRWDRTSPQVTRGKSIAPLPPSASAPLLAQAHQEHPSTNHNGAGARSAVTSPGTMPSAPPSPTEHPHAPTEDPLLGDLEAMYEALDLFVSSRTPSRTLPNHSSAFNHNGATNSSHRASPVVAVSASALCAAEITALTASAKKRQQAASSRVTPDDTTSSSKGSDALFAEPVYNNDAPPPEERHHHKKTHAGLRGRQDISPDGSTTSGTDSLLHRADISISDDSVSGLFVLCCVSYLLPVLLLWERGSQSYSLIYIRTLVLLVYVFSVCNVSDILACNVRYRRAPVAMTATVKRTPIPERVTGTIKALAPRRAAVVRDGAAGGISVCSISLL